MEENNNTIRINKKNVAVGLSKALGWAALGYVSTGVLCAMFGDKTFGELVAESLHPGIIRGSVVASAFLLTTYEYAHDDAYEDFIIAERRYWGTD